MQNTLEIPPHIATDSHSLQGAVKGTFYESALAGFGLQQKHLPSKFLYDAEGSMLFEQICQLPEYYPSRTEAALLKYYVSEIATLLPPELNLIELGSGASIKTHILLDELQQLAAYIPIDISREILFTTAEQLQDKYRRLSIMPIWADYTQTFELPEQAHTRPALLFFPGSTIGNFMPSQAQAFLSRLASTFPTGTNMLLGVDLKKSNQVLWQAYNDSQGITAAFNLNILKRANRELEANFNLAAFKHYAPYNSSKGRVEMHLVSKMDQLASIKGHQFSFKRGESIITEYSHKYSVQEFQHLATKAGWLPLKAWVDQNKLFSIHLLSLN